MKHMLVMMTSVILRIMGVEMGVTVPLWVGTFLLVLNMSEELLLSSVLLDTWEEVCVFGREKSPSQKDT